MRTVGFILVGLVTVALVMIVPLALLWTVKTWQLILNDQLSILTWDAWVASLCTLCIIDGMRRIKVPH